MLAVADFSPGQAHRDAAARRSREQAARVAEIGPAPERDQELWERYRLNLFAYLTERFPHSTGLKPFSRDHKLIIGRIERSILEGGLELIIVYRGFAKSTITELAATWAAGYGHRRFFVPIGADQEAAKTALESIQTEFETNDLLMEIFPEVCHCARALEGVPQRAGKQTINGELTRIEWTSDHCVLPTLPGFAGSGAIIMPRGITANIRGLRFKRPDGAQARPDFVMVDDPQTDESAASPSQVNKRLAKLNKTILRLGGHDKPMACVVNATIIEPDDMVDQLSNAKVYPSWRTSKVPMLRSFSKAHDSFWLGEYADTRSSFNPEDDEDRKRAQQEATDLYRSKQQVADEGAEPSWEHCYGEGEISAVQHAYNILIDTTEDAFMAECQNSPVRDTGGLEMLTPDQICNKMSGYAEHVFPPEATVLTTFVDVHPSILYYHVWAWEPNFTGYCITYGTFPDQRRAYFAHSGITRRLSHLFPGRDVDGTVTAGLEALLHGCEEENWTGLMRREWLRSDGVPMRIARGAIDANGEASDAVKKFIRQSEFAASLSPSYGKGVGAKAKPISQWQQSLGQKSMGPEWVLTKAKPGEPSGQIFDTNYWKTRFHRALALNRGSQGALYLYKAKPMAHRRIADHWVSEKPTEVMSGSRIVYEFSQKPGTDNHDLDCAVGNMVVASRCGITNVKAKTVGPRPQVSFAEMQRQQRTRRGA